MSRRDGHTARSKPRTRAQRRRTFPRPLEELTIADNKYYTGYRHGKNGVPPHIQRKMAGLPV